MLLLLQKCSSLGRFSSGSGLRFLLSFWKSIDDHSLFLSNLFEFFLRKIKTAFRVYDNCPSDRDLSLWRNPDDAGMNNGSTWVAVHEGSRPKWIWEWEIKPGTPVQSPSKERADSCDHPGG